MIQQAMTRQQFEQCKQQFGAQFNVHIDGDEGEARVEGVTARCRYDGETLTVEILDKPFLMPRSLAESFVRRWLELFGAA